MIFSIRTALQLLVALSTVVAAPTYHDGDMLSTRELSSLNYPEARSVMLGHQEYSRGYEGDLVLSARDLSLLNARAGKTCRAGSPTKGIHPRALSEEDKRNVNNQLAVHVKGLADAKASYNSWKGKVASEKDAEKKKFAKKQMASAKEMVDYEQDEIDSCKSLLRSG
jgi:hypothetical protein